MTYTTNGTTYRVNGTTVTFTGTRGNGTFEAWDGIAGSTTGFEDTCWNHFVNELADKEEVIVKKLILCEKKDGGLMEITTTMNTLNYMYDSGMIVRAWYTDGDKKDVMGTDVW